MTLNSISKAASHLFPKRRLSCLWSSQVLLAQQQKDKLSFELQDSEQQHNQLVGS